MFTVNIKGKENPKTPQFVKLEVTFFKTGYSRVTKVLNTTGPLKDWDSQSQQFRSKSTESVETNKRLIELKTKYLKVAEEWTDQKKLWSPVQWSHCFDNVQKKIAETKVISVSKMFDIIDDRLRNRERIKNGKIITSVGTAGGYRHLRHSMEDFTLTKYNRALSSYYFDEMTEEFVNNFILHVQKRGIERGNAGSLIGKLKKFAGVLIYAEKWMNITDANLSIFKHARPLMKAKKTEPKTIPLDVIEKIEYIDRSIFSRLEQFHIDLFLFSYYTGMAPVDICYLTWDCIDNKDMLRYERTKFTKTASLPFSDKARKITEKYQDKCFENYVLPVFVNRHTTESKKRVRMCELRNSVNTTLRKVTKIIKYKNKITWYAARGTFITRVILNGLSPYDVAEMAGNSYQTIFNNYFKEEGKEKDNRQRNAVNF